MSTPASWTLQREVLAVEALRQARHLRLRVHGESMLPSLWPGEIVRIEACSLGDVRRGDIVLAYRDGRFFLHRFVAVCGAGFLARGDSMPAPDPAYSAENLMGKLAAVERGKARVTTVPFGFWSRLLGSIFCHCAFARRLALRLHQGQKSFETDEGRPWILSADVRNQVR